MTISVYIQSVDQYSFYKRIARTADKIGHKVVIITPKLSIHLDALFRGISSHLVHLSHDKDRSEILENTVEIKGAMMDETTAISLFNGVLECVTELHRNKGIDLLLIWNGSSIPAAALSQFAGINNVPTLFMELSNIPGKIFVDPKGVNAQSLLYNDPQILDSYPLVDEKIYDDWKNIYLNVKRNQLTSQTAIYQKAIHNPYFLLDVFGSSVLGLPAIGNMNIWSKLYEKVFLRTKYDMWDHYDVSRGNYIFFPLQLSSDSQILLNSSIDNIEGIRYCLAEGNKKGLDVIVKPHPTEITSSVIDQLITIREKSPIIISNKPTIELIENAAEIVTINSTVGFESMIIGKKTTFLGKSFYPLFDHEALKKYIMHYLIDIEYFSNESIPAGLLDGIINRIIKK